MKDTQSNPLLYELISTLFSLLFTLINLIISFYFAKIIIENLTYKDKPFYFNGQFANFIGLALGGFLLSIITLGVYTAWFLRNIYSFFINNTSYENESFIFQGKGGHLFIILLLTIFLPMVAIIITMTMTIILFNTHGYYSPIFLIISPIIIFLILSSYTYFFYKWLINIDYKNYNIKWETKFWNSFGKIALEIFLVFITLGIYYPMAIIKLYTYFTQRTIAQSDEVTRKFGFDTDNIDDFLLFWGQLLLTIITLGIYFPWMISKLGKRFLSKTYIE